MKLAVPFAVALVVIAVGTIVQGRMMDRWGPSASATLNTFEEKLTHVPMDVGEWEGKDVEGDPTQLRAAKITGSVSREYHDPNTDETVSMFLVCGKSQHIGDHAPDQCYPANGFALSSGPNPYTIEFGDGQFAELYTAIFQNEQAEGTDYVRVFWTWRDGEGGWQAPKYPLLSFAGSPALYKLYFISPTVEPSREEIEKGPTVRFIRQVMPVLEQVLFGDQTSEETAEPAADEQPATSNDQPAAS